MTICIATLCQGGRAVVVASDRMITAEFLAAQFEHPNAKIDLLVPTCVGLTAGDALAHKQLFRATKTAISQLREPSVEHIADRITDEFRRLRTEMIENLLLRPRGLTLVEFYREGLIRGLPPELAMMLDDRIQNTEYPLEVIVAGVDDEEAHIFGVSNPGIMRCYDSLGYHAIGDGQRHALLSLIAGEHSVDTDINRAMFATFQAKVRAEVAVGVGKSTEIGFITENGFYVCTEQEKAQLWGICKDLVAPWAEKIEAAIADLGFDRKASV